MAHDAARRQHSEWLQKQLDQEESKLAEAQAIVAQLQESVAYFRDMLAVVMSNEPNSAFTEKLPKDFFCMNAGINFSENGDHQSRSPADSPLASNTTEQQGTIIDDPNKPALPSDNVGQHGGETASNIVSEDEDFEDEYCEEDEGTEDKNKRNPKEMLQPKYIGMTLGAAAQKVLNDSQSPLNADDIAKAIFDVRSEEEYSRAKNSLSTELRRGAKERRWEKIGRGSFMSNLKSKQSESTSVDIAQQARMSTMNSADI